MTVSRPPETGEGNQVLAGDPAATVVAVTGSGVQLQDVTGTRFTLTHGELLCEAAAGLPDCLPGEPGGTAQWRDEQAARVLTGTSPRAAEPGPQHDPRATTVRQRDPARIADLRAAPSAVPISPRPQGRVPASSSCGERGAHPAVEPCELPDGIRLVYADDRGRRRTLRLEDAALCDFGQVKPFREPPAYRGQRNFPGWWWSASTRSHVVYESWLERHHIIEADRDARVVAISGQPFELTWPQGKKQGGHVPDLFCRMLDGPAVVTDCRPVSIADKDFRRKAAITAAACSRIGWDYRLAGEPDPVWAANLRWLAGYRHPRFADANIEEPLVALFTGAQPLSAARQAGDPIRVRPVLFHLLWRGRLSADLTVPLGETTILTVCADPLEAA